MSDIIGRSPAPRRRGGVAAGCLIVFAVLLILAVAGGIFVWMNWKSWAASITQSAVREVLRESSLPEDQKQAITAEIDTLATDFRDGKVSFEDLSRVGREIAASPLLPLAGVQLAKEKYLDRSDMTAEEKSAAQRSLQRFARAVYEKKLTPAEEQIMDAVKPVVRLKPGNQWEFKENPTREELDQFVANCRRKADEAGIPDEPFEINFAEEVRKIIGAARGGGARSAPSPAPRPPGG